MNQIVEIDYALMYLHRLLMRVRLLFFNAAMLAFGPLTLGAQSSTNYQILFEKYEAKAEQGDVFAQFNLGQLYAKGLGVNQDYVEAAKWYRRAAEREMPTAQYLLGKLHQEGKGVEKDYASAIRLYRAAADSDFGEAQYELGAAAEYGMFGVKRDCAEAVKWYRKAAERGSANGQIAFARLFTEEEPKEEYKGPVISVLSKFAGCYLKKDYVEAYAWYNAASIENGQARFLRDALERKMNEQQIEQGQKRTKELLALVESHKKVFWLPVPLPPKK